jgi:hypothetical protein
LKPKRGAPKREQQKHVDIARAILGRKLRGASWKDITDGLSPVYGITDTRTLQRIFKENEVLVLTEELTRRLQKTGA